MSPTPSAPVDALCVLVADSNRMQARLLTNALRRRPEFRIATCRMETESILHSIAACPAQVALFSLSPSDSLAVNMATLRRFHFSHPEVVKVLLAESSDRELVVSAFRCGARGIFCITDATLRSLCKCIERVASGQIWADAEQLSFLIDLIVQAPALRVLNSQGDSLLTPREEQVVALVVEGLSNRPIAIELNLSEHTVKKYLFRIFEKLGISSRVELVLYAVNHGDLHHEE